MTLVNLPNVKTLYSFLYYFLSIHDYVVYFFFFCIVRFTGRPKNIVFLAVHVCTEKIKGEAVFFAKSGKPFGNRTAVQNLQITAGRSLAGSLNLCILISIFSQILGMPRNTGAYPLAPPMHGGVVSS